MYTIQIILYFVNNNQQLSHGRIGVVKYVGEIQEYIEKGIWYGIDIRMTTGKLGDSNGTIGDTKYFECQNNNGIFLKIQDIDRRVEPSELLANAMAASFPKIMLNESNENENKDKKKDDKSDKDKIPSVRNPGMICITPPNMISTTRIKPFHMNMLQDLKSGSDSSTSTATILSTSSNSSIESNVNIALTTTTKFAGVKRNRPVNHLQIPALPMPKSMHYLSDLSTKYI